MYDKLIILGVGAVVAVGTVLYYLLTEKEEPQKSRSSRSSSSSSRPPTRSRSPPVSYSDIKPKSNRNRKSVSENRETNVGSSERGNMSAYNYSEADTSEQNAPENQNGSQLLPENTNNNSSNSATSSAVCEACDGPADATLYPCKHQKLCNEHAQHYFDLAKNLRQKAKCPDPSCRRELVYFTA